VLVNPPPERFRPLLEWHLHEFASNKAEIRLTKLAFKRSTVVHDIIALGELQDDEIWLVPKGSLINRFTFHDGEIE